MAAPSIRTNSAPRHGNGGIVVIDRTGVAGDLLLAYVSHDQVVRVSSAPGWRVIDVSTSRTDKQYVFARVRDALDPTTWTVVLATTGGHWTAESLAIAGANLGGGSGLEALGIEHVRVTANFASTSHTHAWPAVTTGGADRLILRSVSGDAGGTARSWQATGATERVDTQGPSLAQFLAVYADVQASSGASSTPSVVAMQGGVEADQRASLCTIAIAPTGSPITRVNNAPAPFFAASIVGWTLTLTDQSDEPNGDPMTFHWELGDGSVYETRTPPAHVFAEDGTYSITLTVTDDLGVDASYETSVTARSPDTFKRVPYRQPGPWRRRISPNPVIMEPSVEAVSLIGGPFRTTTEQFTYPLYYSKSGDPLRPVHFNGVFSYVHNEKTLERIVGTPTYMIPLPFTAQPSLGDDGQVVVIDVETGEEWGIRQLVNNGDGTFNAQNGYHYNVNWSGVPPHDQNGNPFGSRGPGMPYHVGQVRPWEIAQGHIDHPLAFAFGTNLPSGSQPPDRRNWPRNTFVYPAQKSDGQSSYVNSLPQGALLQLDPTITEDFMRTVWGLNDAGVVLAKCLQEYGAYVADSSGGDKFYLEADITANPSWSTLGVVADTLGQIPVSALRWIEGPQEVVFEEPGDLTVEVTPYSQVVSPWTFQLARSVNLEIIDDLPTTTSRSLSLQLNRAGSCEVTIDGDDPIAKLVQEIKTCIVVKLYDEIVWTGPVWTINDTIDENGAKTNVGAVGWLQLLEKRITKPEWSGSLPLEYDGVDAGVIALDLITRSNEDTEFYGGPNFLAPGFIEESQPRSLSIQPYTGVLSVIQQLTEVESGFDLYVDPVTRKLHIYRILSTERPHVLFEYGVNVQSGSQQTDSGRLVNLMRVYSKMGGGYDANEEAIREYGAIEEAVALQDTAPTEVLAAYAIGEITVRSRPLKIFSFQPRSASPYTDDPRPFIDYNIGDTAYLTLRRGRLDIAKQLVRIFGMTITVNENGWETVSNITTTASGG